MVGIKCVWRHVTFYTFFFFFVSLLGFISPHYTSKNNAFLFQCIGYDALLKKKEADDLIPLFFFFLSRVCLCVVFLFCACPIEHYSPYLRLRLYVVWLFVTAIIKKPITQFPLSALKVIVNLTLFSICNFPFFLLNFASLLTQFQLRTILS